MHGSWGKSLRKGKLLLMFKFGPWRVTLLGWSISVYKYFWDYKPFGLHICGSNIKRNDKSNIQTNNIGYIHYQIQIYSPNKVKHYTV